MNEENFDPVKESMILLMEFIEKDLKLVLCRKEYDVTETRYDYVPTGLKSRDIINLLTK